MMLAIDGFYISIKVDVKLSVKFFTGWPVLLIDIEQMRVVGETQRLKFVTSLFSCF